MPTRRVKAKPRRTSQPNLGAATQVETETEGQPGPTGAMLIRRDE
jgi:hypothetical protein